MISKSLLVASGVSTLFANVGIGFLTLHEIVEGIYETQKKSNSTDNKDDDSIEAEIFEPAAITGTTLAGVTLSDIVATAITHSASPVVNNQITYRNAEIYIESLSSEQLAQLEVLLDEKEYTFELPKEEKVDSPKTLGKRL